MRINKVIITRLFGMFDHDIPFKVDDRITIIHGPNGVGKTTILKLIADLFSMRFRSLRSTPYDQLIINFDNNSILTIQRRPGEESQEPFQVIFTFKKGKKKSEHKLLSLAEIRNFRRRFPLSAIEEYVEPLERIGPSTWFDHSTGDNISLDEALYRYSDILPVGLFETDFEFPSWLHDIITSLPAHFIQTQRLFAVPSENIYEDARSSHSRSSRRYKTESMVKRYSNNMATQIQETLRQSGSLAASLDRMFPQRLIKSKLPKKAAEKFILLEYEKQTNYRNRLMEAGLIDAEHQVELPKRRLYNSERKVLWYYLSDVNKKLQVFDELLSKVELFKDIINTRFLYKTFTVDKENGFVFTTQKKEVVPLTALSSGEQHELVLSYQLLFKVKQKSLILIDEPELSLHVTWQHKFLDDIGRISKLADLDFLIATHSPSIIHKRSDLMVPLGGPD